jgi:hypothetical protein
MGCDIHGTIEMKQSDLGGGDGLWYTVAKLDRILGRSYDHFAHLFGVRYYEGEHEILANGYEDGMEPKQLYADRGLPHDIAEATQREYNEWGPDAHSESFAYHHEIESALEATSLLDNEDWMAALDVSRRLAEFFGENEYVDGQVRWVVWFDN